MSIYQFAMIIRSRWILVAAVSAVIIFATALLCLVLPKSYTATSAVMLDYKQDPVANVSQLVPGYLGTQVKILYSQPVAERVISLLKLDQSPQVQQDWIDQTDRKVPFQTWLVARLQAGLDIDPSKEANVIEINYRSADPNIAANLSNAFAKAYVDTNLQLRTEPARQYTDFFNARGQQARAQLEAAQSKLTAYQREKGLVLTDERVDIENAKLAELSGQLSGVKALVADATSRQAQATGRPDESPDVTGNAIVMGLRSEILRAEAGLQAMSDRLGDSHPSVVESRTNLRALRARLDAETRRATQGVAVSSTIARQREAEAQAAFDAQRARVLKLKEQRDEALVLEREVDSAKATYQAVLARETQTAMESQMNQTNVVLLNRANVPGGHSFPKTPLFMTISLGVGLFLGLCAAFIVEMFDRRLRTSDDVVQGLSLSVLGVMRKPTGIGKLRRQEVPWMQRHVLKTLPSPTGADSAA